MRACARAREISSAIKSRSMAKTGSTGIGFEIWVESKEKAVGGWIDAARATKDGIVLSDFKSGEVLDRDESIPQGQLKDSHCVQLRLYAALYSQTYGIWPRTIQIVPLAGAKLEIPFTEEQCTQVLQEAVATFRLLNTRITCNVPELVRTLGSPAPANCSFCPYRPACPAYRQVLQSAVEANRGPSDAFGRVWDINLLRDGRVNLRVAGEQRQEHIFRALSSARHPALETIRRGDHVGIFNARVSSNREEFSEAPSTVLYKLSGDAAY